MNTTRSPILLVQCKAYQSSDEVSAAIANLLNIHSAQAFAIHISLPYSFMETISKKFPDSGIHLGAESLLDTDNGSFTGSIAVKMLKDAQAAFVLIGSVQDRTSHSASSNHLKNKVKVALENNLRPFICIGETLQEHQDKESKDILIKQLKECTEGLSSEDLKSLHIVYNAEWISRTPWESGSPELQDAYKIFKEAVDETLTPEIFPTDQLIVAVPAYSEDVTLLIKALQAASTPFVNYSVGILGLSSEFLKPFVLKIANGEPQSPPAEPTAIPSEEK